MGKEIWKDIDDYEGFYQVSNLGRVRSLDNWIWNGTGFFLKPGKVLIPMVDLCGGGLNDHN